MYCFIFILLTYVSKHSTTDPLKIGAFGLGTCQWLYLLPWWVRRRNVKIRQPVDCRNVKF